MKLKGGEKMKIALLHRKKIKSNNKLIIKKLRKISTNSRFGDATFLLKEVKELESLVNETLIIAKKFNEQEVIQQLFPALKIVDEYKKIFQK